MRPSPAPTRRAAARRPSMPSELPAADARRRRRVRCAGAAGRRPGAATRRSFPRRRLPRSPTSPRPACRAPTPEPTPLVTPAADRHPSGRRAAAHPARHARHRPDRPRGPDVHVAAMRPAAARRRSRRAGQALMQSQRLAKSVSQALIGSAAGVPRGEGERRRAGDERAQPAHRRRHRRGRAGGGAGGARDRSCRWSTAPRRTPAPCWRSRRSLTAGRRRAARHQPPVVRPARDRRDHPVAQAAARRQPDRDLGRSASSSC